LLNFFCGGFQSAQGAVLVYPRDGLLELGMTHMAYLFGLLNVSLADLGPAMAAATAMAAALAVVAAHKFSQCNVA
jgi:hypothetical protein